MVNKYIFVHVGSDCRYAVGWKYDQNTVTFEFEMFGKADGYLSLGWSHDERMVGKSKMKHSSAIKI